MNVSTFLPMFITMAAPKENRRQMFQMTIPSMLPVSPNLQGAVTALSANNVTRQQRAEIARLSDEVVDFAKATENGEKEPTQDQLNSFRLITKHKLNARIMKRLKDQQLE